MKTITIEIPDSLDDSTIETLRSVLNTLARVEWSMLLQLYRATRYEVHRKGDDIDVRATVWK